MIVEVDQLFFYYQLTCSRSIYSPSRGFEQEMCMFYSVAEACNLRKSGEEVKLGLNRPRMTGTLRVVTNKPRRLVLYMPLVSAITTSTAYRPHNLYSCLNVLLFSVNFTTAYVNTLVCIPTFLLHSILQLYISFLFISAYLLFK